MHALRRSQALKLPCGLYRTTRPIGEDIPAGVLVYFDSRGEPGPGVYLPEQWKNNRAVFHRQGTTLPDDSYAESLQPLIDEGMYRVVEAFFCCDQRCQHFEPDLLVQLGYNAEAEPILFVPEMVEGAIALPAEGTLIEESVLQNLRPLKLPISETSYLPLPSTTLQ